MNGSNGFTSVNGNGHTLTPPPQAPTTTAAATAGIKRKRTDKAAPKFYAVRIGFEPGIYHSWAECLEQVRGFPKAAFKSFTSLTDAQAWQKNESESGGGTGGGSSGKFYAVQSGRNPGVYGSWPEVLEQITGWRAPKHKMFKTRSEAELFVAEGQYGTNGYGNGETVESIEKDEGAPQKKLKTGKGKKGGVKDEVDGYGMVGEEYEPGDGPLPEDAEDNFDHTIVLDQATGHARYKTAAEMSKTKYMASAPVADSPIRIYTDGSTLSNGQTAAIGGVGVYFGPLDRRNISEPLTGSKQTNQRAELTAILRALEVAPRDRKIMIISDSKYAISCVTEWFVKWRERNWVNSSNKTVENKDLVQKILEMLEERIRLNQHCIVDYDDENADEEGEPKGYWDRGPGSVKFVWVKGHAKEEGNNAADELAVNGARTARELGEDVELD